MKLTKKIVKKKKLQLVSKNLTILIPKLWIEELEWTRETYLILEFLPHRKTIIISQEKKLNIKNEDEEDSDIVAI